MVAVWADEVCYHLLVRNILFHPFPQTLVAIRTACHHSTIDF